MAEGPAWLQRPYVWLVLILGRVIFRYGSLSYVWTVFRGLFGANGNAFSNFSTLTVLKSNFVLLLLCLVFVTPLFRELGSRLEKATAGRGAARGVFEFVRFGVIPAALLLLSTAMLVGNSYNPFLYFRF